MEAASFTAWQIMRSNGFKKSWDHYRKAMGLVESKKKIDKTESKKAQSLALEIHKKRMAAKGGK